MKKSDPGVLDHKPEGLLDVLFYFFILIVFVSKATQSKKQQNKQTRKTLVPARPVKIPNRPAVARAMFPA